MKEASSRPLRENILLQELKRKSRAMSLDEVIELFRLYEIAEPKRLAKETILKLVEEGSLRFTRDWEVEIVNG